MPLDNTQQPASNEAEYANFIPHGVRRAAERAAAMQAEYVAGPPADPAEPVVEPVVDTTVVEPVVVQQTPPPIDWEQRYRTLQGKYDREVPALRGDVATMRSQLETLSAQLTAKPAPAAPEPVTIPDADKEVYGEDLVTATRRWARAEVAGELETLKSQLAEVKQATTTVQQDNAQSRAQQLHQNTMNGLDAHPEIGRTWRTVNVDDNFISWLQQDDPFTGGPRMKLLSDAFGRGDVNRTAAFFKAFVAESTPHQQASAGGQPTPQPGTDRPTLQTFASPGRATGPAPGGAQPDKRFWTPPEITAFYRAKSRGDYRDDPAKAASLEQDLVAAAAEGRIRQ